ncbi:MAG: PEP-CTERM sorting domain-containing protein [Cyanobacteria bacterium P01_D01_bin.116]
MFSNIFQKAALLGASTVASVAFTGTMMANSAQAATMSYISEFSVTSNSLNSNVLTANLSFTKTELAEGLFGYKLINFDTTFGAFGITKSLDLDDVKANPNPFLAINQALIPQEYNQYKTILPSVLAEEEYNYIGDGDFPADDFSRAFTGKEFFAYANQLNPAISSFLESSDIDINPQLASILLSSAFADGGEVKFTTTSVPEPATIFGLGVVGIGLTATRRKRANQKIKQKAVV